MDTTFPKGPSAYRAASSGVALTKSSIDQTAQLDPAVNKSTNGFYRFPFPFNKKS